MTSIVARAAREFLNDEAKREKRPRFTEGDRNSLHWYVNTLEDVTGDSAFVHAQRGRAAVDLIGYGGEEDEEPAVNVIADILQHVKAIGLDPMTVLAHARAEFFRDEKLGPIGVPSEDSEVLS
ncbi:hypothetical protein HOT31_gp125 [Microbacterium phage Hendrix]|uniref:Uncharacterized protein n=1 Tax=Microbacterium phage Hendrix TaxID=2182341 RepID=A0A2U8UUA8_9CAUD|nr:hypothetical protein HOT31_gp125 [Microbacterium phage Hendrix]AWN07795.1 hypothetical protein PBI_HENDRIX_124 [Microbacterium phage Hendrix]